MAQVQGDPPRADERFRTSPRQEIARRSITLRQKLRGNPSGGAERIIPFGRGEGQIEIKGNQRLQIATVHRPMVPSRVGSVDYVWQWFSNSR